MYLGGPESDHPCAVAMLSSIDHFDGTAADLMDLLKQDKPPKDWPKSGRAVTTLLRRHAPALRRAGWSVTDDGGRNHQNAVRWALRRPEIARNSSSRDSQTRANGVGRESASQKYGPGKDDWIPVEDSEIALREAEL